MREGVLHCYIENIILLYKHELAESYINKGFLEFSFDQIT